MKKYIILFYALIWSLSSTAQTKFDVKDGPFLNSIDWFIKSTVDYWTNLSTPQKITSFNQLGVVVVDFYNMPDSVELRKNLKEDSYGNTTDIIEHHRCQYIVTAQSRAVTIMLPPSYYFIRNGVPVVVYTGFERLVQFKKADMEFKKSPGSDKMEIHLDAVTEYWIKMDPRYPNGYISTEVKKDKMTNQ